MPSHPVPDRFARRVTNFVADWDLSWRGKAVRFPGIKVRVCVQWNDGCTDDFVGTLEYWFAAPAAEEGQWVPKAMLVRFTSGVGENRAVYFHPRDVERIG